MHYRTLAAVLLVAVAAAGARAQQEFSEGEAESLRQKLQVIIDRAAAEAPPPRTPLVTSVSDREVNAYLRHVVGPDLPAGLVDPTIAIADRGRLGFRAKIDLDAVRKSRARGALDPLNWVSGTLELVLNGTLEAARGRGTFALESATLGGVPVPQSLVQELVTYMTKTPENPVGIGLSEPFELPAAIQQIRTRPGHATIVQ
jgi:hypothetical protein